MVLINWGKGRGPPQRSLLCPLLAPATQGHATLAWRLGSASGRC